MTNGAENEVLGRRVLGGLIDLAALAGVFVVVSLLAGGVNTGGATGVRTTASLSVSLTGWAFVLFAGLCFAYYFVLELRTGQTLGKRALGLRVIDINGAAPSAGAVLLRTLGRIIDVLPIFYLVGLIALNVGRPRQRIGDRLAGTTVVAA
jgi:uncharacterized RDD family membrane protein YckC